MLRRTGVIFAPVGNAARLSRGSPHVTASYDNTAIREQVRKLCAQFPGAYWRALDRERAYPDEFVRALTEAGWLAALIPEEYGGSGLPPSAAPATPGRIPHSGGNGGAPQP